MPFSVPVTNETLADAFDALGRAAFTVRKLVPQMSVEQLLAIAECCPFNNTGEDLLLELDVFGAVTAAHFRGVEDIELTG